MTLDFKAIGQQLLDEAYMHGPPQPETPDLTCKTCHGACYVKGDKRVQENGHTVIEYDAKPCPDCQRPLEQRMAAAGVKKTFAEWESSEALKPALEGCMRLLEGSQWCLLLRGGVGIGKTHLAHATAAEWVTRGGSAKILTVGVLLGEMRKTIGVEGQSIEAVREQHQDVGLLVLDDWRAISAWAQGEMYELVNHRYNARLPLMVTTNTRQLEKAVESRLSSGLVEIRATDRRKDFD